MTQPNAWTPVEAHSTATLLHSLRVPLESDRTPWWPDGVAPEGWTD